MADVKDGNIGNGYSEEQLARKMHRFYDMRVLSISGEPSDVKISTKYPGLDLVQIANPTESTVTVVLKTKVEPTTAKTIKIAALSCNSYVLPPIEDIVKSGTSDGIQLLFQKR